MSMEIGSSMQLVSKRIPLPVGRCTGLLAVGDPRATADLDRFVKDGLQVPRPRVRYLTLLRAAMLAVTAGRFEEAESLIA